MKFPEQYLKTLDNDLKRGKWFYGYRKNEIIRFPGSRRGNKAYATQTQLRVDAVVSELCKMDGTLFFITLTVPYNKNSEKSIFESWEMAKKRWPVFLQWAHRKGFNEYMMSYEASEDGGCHIHLILNYKDKLNIDVPLCEYIRNDITLPVK